MPDSLTLKTETGRGIEKYLHDLAKLRIEVFREFPYLYDGSPEYEKNVSGNVHPICPEHCGFGL